MSRDIALVGLSCVFPKARNAREYWGNNVNGVDGIAPIPDDRWVGARNFEKPSGHEARLHCERGGFLEGPLLFDPTRYGILPNAVTHGDPDQFFLLQVIDEALADGGVSTDDPVRERTDVFVGRGGYVSHKLAELCLRAELFDTVLDLIDRKDPALLGNRRGEIEEYLRSTLSPNEEELVSTAVSNISASRAANRLNLRGTAQVVDTACASSLTAVEEGVIRLRAGTCDLAVAAGVFLNQTPTLHHVFTRLGALSPSGVIRPFDRSADGLVVGEGGGAVILKRLDDAIRDDDAVYAVIKGVGSSSDGRALDVLAPNSDGQVLALERAYDDAGIDPDTIGYLEAHGTATTVGDEAEIRTVNTFFGESDEPATTRAMGSVKSMIGHTMPAAGMASLIRTAMALSNKVLPPSLHCDEPREGLERAKFFVNTEARPWVQPPSAGPRRAGINAFGFGGINAHVILEEVPQALLVDEVAPSGVKARARTIVPGIDVPTEIVALGAPSVAEMLATLDEVAAHLDDDGRALSLADLAYTYTSDADPEHSCRLAMVCSDLDELGRLLEVSRQRLREAGDEVPDDLFSDEEAIRFAAEAVELPGRVACVMPGMGLHMIGNYPDQLMQLALHFPHLREEFDFFAERDQGRTSVVFAPPAHLPEEAHQELKQRLAPPSMLGKLEKATTEEHDLAMTVSLANWIGWRLIEGFGIPIDMLAGQSQGEVTAMCAAGVVDFHDIMPRVWESLDSPPEDPELHDRIWEEIQASRLCFAWTDEETVQPFLDETPGTYLAICMTPQSVVVGGPTEAVNEVAAKLREREIFVQILPFPTVHSPVLTPLRERLWKDAMEDETEFHPPNSVLYSSITTEPYPEDPDEALHTLMLNLDHPLRLWQTIERMHADGARVFIQLAGGGLVEHVREWTGEGDDLVAVPLNTESRHPLTQLHHLCSVLWVAGAPLRFDPLYAHRGVERLGPFAEEGREGKSLRIPLRLDWTPLEHPNVPSPSHPPEEAGVGSSPAASADPSAASEEDPERGGTEAESSLRKTGMPFLGTILHFEPEQEIRLERLLDLDEDRFLADHLFIHAEGVKPPEVCLPVLAMSFGIEVVAEAAAAVCPGLGVIGIEDVRAKRWIGMRDRPKAPIRVTARATEADPGTDIRRVETSIEFEGRESFTATVLCGSSYRRDLEWRLPEPDPEETGSWPWSANEIYSSRRMFHGPSYQCLTGLGAFGNPISEAELVVLPKDGLFASNPDPVLLTDPSLVDGVAQVVGLWAQVFGWWVMPTALEHLELYAPTPPVGTRVKVRLQVMDFDLDTRQMRSRFEVGDGSGGLWMRIEGFRDWVFSWPQRFADFLRQPFRRELAEPVSLPDLPSDAVCMRIDMDELWHADLDWASRTILHTEEMTGLEDISDPVARRHLVWSRAAVKEAARRWIGNGTPATFHPASLRVRHDQRGRPMIVLPEDGSPTPHVSIAHKGRTAVALAASSPVGIDIEPVAHDTDAVLDDFATAEERALLEAREGELESPATRLWCAKEAASKCLGTGLRGRPKELVAVEVRQDGVFVMEHRPTSRRFRVTTCRVDHWIVAHTVDLEPEGSPETSRGRVVPGLG